MIRVKTSFIFVYLCMTNTLFAQWVQTNASYGGNVGAIVSSGANLFAGAIGVGVVLSNNNGISWSRVDTGLSCLDVTSLSMCGKNLFAGTYSGGIFLSTNNGLTWTAIDSGLTKVVTLPDTLIPTKIGSFDHPKIFVQSVSTHDTVVNVKFISSLTFSNNNLFAGTMGSGVYRYIDSSQYWVAVDSGLGKSNWIFSLSATDSTVFAATETGLYYTSNNGINWNAINNGLIDGIITHNISAAAVNGDTIFAGTDVRGVFRSTDNGLSWGQFNNGLLNKVIYSFLVYAGNIFVGTNSGIFLLKENDTSWIPAGLSNHGIISICVCGTDLFVGTTDSGIWKRPLSELLTYVDQGPTEVPKRNTLHQNYPNPFNPTTTISFNLTSKAQVLLKIFNILGSEVATIVDEELSPGNYVRQWNAKNISTGVYFYRLQAGTFTETKKLILLK